MVRRNPRRACRQDDQPLATSSNASSGNNTPPAKPQPESLPDAQVTSSASLLTTASAIAAPIATTTIMAAVISGAVGQPVDQGESSSTPSAWTSNEVAMAALTATGLLPNYVNAAINVANLFKAAKDGNSTSDINLSSLLYETQMGWVKSAMVEPQTITTILNALVPFAQSNKANLLSVLFPLAKDVRGRALETKGGIRTATNILISEGRIDDAQTARLLAEFETFSASIEELATAINTARELLIFPTRE